MDYPETYLEITGAVIPSSCQSGGTLVTSVTVHNKHTEALTVRVLGGYNTAAVVGAPEYVCSPASVSIPADGIQVFTCSVVMPNESIDFFVVAYYYGDDDAWHADDIASSSVTVTSVIVPAEGVSSMLTSIMPLIMLMMVMMMLMPMFKGMAKGFSGSSSGSSNPGNLEKVYLYSITNEGRKKLRELTEAGHTYKPRKAPLLGSFSIEYPQTYWIVLDVLSRKGVLDLDEVMDEQHKSYGLSAIDREGTIETLTDCRDDGYAIIWAEHRPKKPIIERARRKTFEMFLGY